AFIWSRSAGPDPECGIVWGSEGSMNFSRFSSKEVDAALARGRENGSHASRAPIYRKKKDILANEGPWVFLVQPDLLIAHEQDIINTKQAHQEMTGLPWDNPLFNAADWQRSTGN